MADKIEEIEGIGPVYAEKLGAAGIKTTEDLLAKAGSAKGRAELEAATGISGAHLLKWVNHADLMRIHGVGGQYAELLEAAGVDTVKELRHRNAENLAAKLAEVNEQKKLTGNVPSVSMVAKWIEEAKGMEPAVSH
jgi:predicted flap endonuclease-1-like 5' DNA nuclease